jgi:eukaryotic-like serine/threonine-protein kinase
MMRALVANAPSLPQSPTVPGTVLAGKYRVERILGQGGMGVVVEARHIALDERVALKFLLPEYASHPEAAARFLREARNAVKIKSEHVARVSDVGTLDTGAPYMVMEFLEGRDLSGVLEKTGVISIPDSVDYIIQGSEAIAEAHSHGIVHRDLKPANLFLSKRPDGMPIVKVLDFGISKNSGAGVDNLTKTTAAMGSALYMSPEQMQQTRSVDHRTDIYALGISLYELLAGKQPFYAETLPQLCAEILTGVATPLRQARPDVPEGLALVIERAYARDRAARYQSVAELVVALAPFAPARSQNTIERVARMGGLQLPPLVGSSGVFAAPASADPRVGGPPQAAPMGPAPHPQGGGTQLVAPHSPYAAHGAPTVPLPAMDPTAGPDGGYPQTPSPAGGYPQTPGMGVMGAAPAPPPPGHQIVPGPYNGPMSVRAAASFAQGGTTNAALSTTGRQAGGNKAGVFALVVVALLALGGGGVAIALRYGAPKASPATAQTAAMADPSVLPTASAVASPIESAVASATATAAAQPADVKSADAPTPSAVPVHGKNGLKSLPAPHATAAPQAPAHPPSLGDLPESVYDGKHK